VACARLSELVERRKPRLLKIDVEGFEYRVLKRYFQDGAPEREWPEYILLEDLPDLREGESVRLCEENGYSVLHRWEFNVALRR